MSSDSLEVKQWKTRRKGEISIWDPNIIRAAIVNGGGATDFCARLLDESDKPLRNYTVTLSANGSVK